MIPETKNQRKLFATFDTHLDSVFLPVDKSLPFVFPSEFLALVGVFVPFEVEFDATVLDAG